uniref:Uncharacterized protein n=1 Tax=Rhizophora mucronata TaxID=61149 RepID=A0A2P2PIM7_RHIMU
MVSSILFSTNCSMKSMPFGKTCMASSFIALLLISSLLCGKYIVVSTLTSVLVPRFLSLVEMKVTS